MSGGMTVLDGLARVAVGLGSTCQWYCVLPL